MNIWLDGFDCYGALSLNYDVPGVGNPIQSGIARPNMASKDLGGVLEIPKAVQISLGSWFGHTFPAAYTSLVAGGAVRVNTYPGTREFAVVSFYDSVTTNVQVEVRINSQGQPTIHSNGVLKATATLQIPVNQFHYIELKYAGGAATVHVDGADVGLTSTFALPNSQITQVAWGRNNLNSGSTTYYIDDVFVNDTTGAVNNDFLGDIIIPSVLAIASGAFTQWTIKPASSKPTNWQNVNENPPDGDTTYVYDSVATDRDSYIFANDPLSNTILAVCVMGDLETDAGGSRIVQLSARQASTDKFSPSFTIGPNTYAYYNWIMETDVNNNPWTQANFNAPTEFGVKTIS